MPIFLFDKVEMTHRSLCRDVQNWNMVVILQLSVIYAPYLLCVSFVPIVCGS